MQETQGTQVGFLGWEDPLKEEMATHSRILTWKIPQREEPGGSMGSQKSQTQLSTHINQKQDPEGKIRMVAEGDRKKEG